MSSPLPPDPYQALGVAKDATGAQIKTVYRKLVLKCHPDKILDPAKKQAAVDEFHKIQTAYEIIGDDQRRQRYDAAIKLAELRRAAMEERLRRPAARDDHYPRPYTTAESIPRTYAARDRVYEERRPENAYERRSSDPYASDYPFDMPPRATSRKEDDRYERTSNSKRSPPKSDRERAREKPKSSKESILRGKDKAKKSEREIKREREEIKRDRERKYAPSVQSSPSDSGSDSPYERQRSRMQEDEVQHQKQAEEIRRRMREEEELQRKLREDDEQRRRMREAEEYRRTREAYYDPARRQTQTSRRRDVDDPAARADKIFQAEAAARNHMQKVRGHQDERDISPARSAKDKTETIRDKHGNPVQIRRGTGKTKPAEKSKSSKTKTSDKSRSPREQEVPRTKVHDIVDSEVPRRPATLNQSYSSPEAIRIPDNIPSFDEKARSASMDQRREREAPSVRPPQMRRAETMPIPQTSFTTSAKKTNAPTRSSNLRTQTTPTQAASQQVPTYEIRPEPVQQAAPKTTTATKKATAATATRSSDPRKTEMKYGQPTPQASPAYDSAPEFEYPTPKAAYARDEDTESEDEIIPNVRRAATFKTEVREPLSGQGRSRERYTRSPEPIAEPVRDPYRETLRDPIRETTRAASSRYAERPKPTPTQRGETRSASYFVKTGGYESDSRPKASRTESTRSKPLYGEIPRTASSPKVQQSRHSPPADPDSYTDVRPATGYVYASSSSRRPSATVRPSYGSRHGSYNQRTPVYA